MMLKIGEFKQKTTKDDSTVSDSKLQSEVGTPQLKKSTRSSQKKIDVEALPPVELPATCFVTPVKEEACPPPLASDPTKPTPDEQPDLSPAVPTVLECSFFGFASNRNFRPSLNPSKVDAILSPAKLPLYEAFNHASIFPVELIELDDHPTNIDGSKRRMSIYNSIAQINKSISSINHNKSHIEKTLSRQSSHGHLNHGQDKLEEDFLIFEEGSFDPNKMMLETQQEDNKLDKSLSLEADESFEKLKLEPEPKMRGSL